MALLSYCAYIELKERLEKEAREKLVEAEVLESEGEDE